MWGSSLVDNELWKLKTQQEIRFWGKKKSLSSLMTGDVEGEKKGQRTLMLSTPQAYKCFASFSHTCSSFYIYIYISIYFYLGFTWLANACEKLYLIWINNAIWNCHNFRSSIRGSPPTLRQLFWVGVGDHVVSGVYLTGQCSFTVGVVLP